MKTEKPTSNTNWISEDFEEGLVSVIIPLYNRAHLITKTLDSVVGQTYRPIECIIVDDGSTDDSGKVLTDYINAYKGDVKLIYKSKINQGPQSARNLGTKLSRGEFIQYLDSDDLLFPDKIFKQVSFLNSHLNFKGVFSHWSTGSSLNEYIQADNYETFNKIIDIATYFEYGPIVNFAPLLRRLSVRDIGEWDEELTVNEELDYHIRFLLLGFQWNYINQNGGLWRTHKDFRLSSSNNYANLFYFYSKHEQLLKSKDLWSENIALNFGRRIFWKIVSNTFSNSWYRIKLMRMAVRFNKELPHFKSKKVKIFTFFLGKQLSTVLWFYFILPFVRKSSKP